MIRAIKNFFEKRAQKKRQKLGGRWELWIMDYCGSISEEWFQRNNKTSGRPHILCRGTPLVEVYDEVSP